MKISKARKSKKMNNITQNFKESLLANNYKLIYPNSKKIEIRVFAKKLFSLTKKAQDIEQLTLMQKFLHWGELFLNEERYKFIRDIKKDELLIEFFNGAGFEEKFIFSTIKIYNENGSPYYSLYPKKIKEIYLNFDSKSVIIVIDERFNTKKEKAWIKKEKKKGNFTKNLDSLIG